MTCQVCGGRGYKPFCSNCHMPGKGPRPTFRDRAEERFEEKMKLIVSERDRLAKPPGRDRGIPKMDVKYLVEFVVVDANDKFVQSYGVGFKKTALDHAVEIEGMLIPVLVPHKETL